MTSTVRSFGLLGDRNLDPPLAVAAQALQDEAAELLIRP